MGTIPIPSKNSVIDRAGRTDQIVEPEVSVTISQLSDPIELPVSHDLDHQTHPRELRRVVARRDAQPIHRFGDDRLLDSQAFGSL